MNLLHYNSAILRKLAIFLGEVANGSGCRTSLPRTLTRHAARKKNVFAALEALLKLGGHRDVCEWLRLAHCCLPHTGTMLKPTTVEFLNGLGLADKRPVPQQA